MRGWTKEETILLKEIYPKEGIQGALKAFPFKSKSAIKSRCFKLNLKTKNYFYTEKEIKFLKDNYETKGAKWCAEQLNRSPDAVSHYAAKVLKILKKPTHLHVS